jgi:hypothetical protein
MSTEIITKTSNFFTNPKNVLYIIIGVLGLLLGLSTCNNGCSNPFKKVSSDTVVVRTTDTAYVQQPPVQIPVYIPIQSGSSAPIYIPQPSNDNAELVAQFRQLAEQHYRNNFYSDRIQLRDSSGKDVGFVNVNDTISQNKIAGRGVNYQLKFPVITNTITTTITNTIQEPPKRQLYIGGGITGTTTLPINGFNAKLLYKDKKDNQFGVSAGLLKIAGLPKMQPQFEISKYWKIKLKK